MKRASFRSSGQQSQVGVDWQELYTVRHRLIEVPAEEVLFVKAGETMGEQPRMDYREIHWFG
jgi:hypothetical protein